FLCAALVAYVTIQRLLGALDREQLAQQVLTRAYKLKEGVASMSASESALHLLGDPVFEKQYRASRELLLHHLADLRGLVGADGAARADRDPLADRERPGHRRAEEGFKRLAGGGPADRGGAGLPLREEMALQRKIRARADALVAAERERLGER